MRGVSLLVVLAACSPASVRGQVDGEGVGGARDAIWDELSIDLGPLGEYSVTAVILTDFPEACAVFEGFYEDAFQLSCDDVCDEYLELAQTYDLDREAYWSLSLSINTSDGFEGTFDFDRELGDDEFVADYSAWDATPLQDAGVCEDTCEDGDLLDPDTDEGEDGTLELEGIDDEDVLRGQFETSFGGEDGLQGSFRATRCDMSEWFF
jgi:hypothetical protein